MLQQTKKGSALTFSAFAVSMAIDTGNAIEALFDIIVVVSMINKKKPKSRTRRPMLVSRYII